jgi:arylsulfatase A-like enzyme
MSRLVSLAVLASLGAFGLGCPKASPPAGPRALLAEGSTLGRPKVDVVTIGDEAREALLESHSWTIAFPGRARLTFGVGASFDGSGEPPGWARFSVAIDGREVASETLNPRVAHDWKDVVVELDGPAREGTISIAIRFTDKHGSDLARPPGLRLAVSQPVVHDPLAYGLKRGVILISVDTLRRDHVGAYGYSKPTTPNIDSLAAHGVLAEDAVSVSSWTLPAHLSMLTSVLPGGHGGTDLKTAFNRSVPSVAEILQARGVSTHAVTSHLYVSKTYGVDAGFDSMNFRQDRVAANVANHAMDLIDRFGDRPFFVFLHFYDPHWHYAPPAEALKFFETSYSGTLTGNLKDFQKLRPDQVKPEDLAHLLALYDGEIRYTDNEIGRLLTHLRERDVLRNTLVVVTSDHGEEFLEHGSWEHQKTLYEEVVRVPLVVSGPALKARREPQPTSLLDIAPTILEFLGVPVPPAMAGTSLLRSVTDKREMYGETDHTLDGSRLAFLRGGARSWKAIVRLDPAKQAERSSEWFDLAVDPREIASRPPPETLRQKVRSRVRDIALQSRTAAAGKPVELSAEQKEKLRALGYVGR